MRVTIIFFYAYYSKRIRTTLKGTNIKDIKHETGQNRGSEQFATVQYYEINKSDLFKRNLLQSLNSIRQSPSLKSCRLEGGEDFSSFYLDNSFHVKLTKSNRFKIVTAIEKLLKHRAIYPNFYNK